VVRRPIPVDLEGIVMMVGTRVGPFYVSTGVGSTTSLIGLAVKAVVGLLAVFWPLMLGQKASGGWHPWVWAIAAPWWILLAVLGVGYLVAKAQEGKQ
jgi:hypothetical protein